MPPVQPFGRLVQAWRGAHRDQAAILLSDRAPDLLLRFAFVRYGSEQPLFPALILDDWGGTISGAAMYSWYREFADQFPRAEIFGYEANGRHVQRFVREFEIYDQLACYAYDRPDAPLAAGREIQHVLLPDPATAVAQRVTPPPESDQLLRWSRLTWWSVTPDWSFPTAD